MCRLKTERVCRNSYHVCHCTKWPCETACWPFHICPVSCEHLPQPRSNIRSSRLRSCRRKYMVIIGPQCYVPIVRLKARIGNAVQAVDMVASLSRSHCLVTFRITCNSFTVPQGKSALSSTRTAVATLANRTNVSAMLLSSTTYIEGRSFSSAPKVVVAAATLVVL